MLSNGSNTTNQTATNARQHRNFTVASFHTGSKMEIRSSIDDEIAPARTSNGVLSPQCAPWVNYAEQMEISLQISPTENSSPSHSFVGHDTMVSRFDATPMTAAVLLFSEN